MFGTAYDAAQRAAPETPVTDALETRERPGGDARHPCGGKAVEQIGSDKAAGRLAGFYTLERLAQDNVDQRQTTSR